MSLIMMIFAAIRLFFEIWKLLREIKGYAKKAKLTHSVVVTNEFKEALDLYAKTHDKSQLIALRDKLKQAAGEV